MPTVNAFEAIQNAQTALRRGDKLSVRRWAALAASLAPEREEPWLLLAAVASPQASLGYLKQALKVNPASQRAKAGMSWALKRVEAAQSVTASRVNVSKSGGTSTQTAITPPTRVKGPNMPRFVQFLARRMFTIPLSLLIITMLLYGGVMLTPPEVRATLYLSKGRGGITQNMIDNIIKDHHLDAPYLVQYGYWLQSLAQGSWGYSPSLREDVLPAILRRTPVTAELAFFSLVLFIPLGLVSGVQAGWRQRQRFDTLFRITAFVATSLPPFILALVLISIFYVNLGWFAPERISTMLSYQLPAQGFHFYTGFYTIDGLLNGRPDVTLEALRHLVMPVVTLSLYHWATLGRITRATLITERTKDYITSARARGVSDKQVMWKHAFRNVIAPSVTSLALSAASLVTGVFLVEMIFAYDGISQVIVHSIGGGAPDAPAALGFSIYSVVIVLLMMFLLDIVQAVLDPRVRDEVLRT